MIKVMKMIHMGTRLKAALASGAALSALLIAAPAQPAHASDSCGAGWVCDYDPNGNLMISVNYPGQFYIGYFTSHVVINNTSYLVCLGNGSAATCIAEHHSWVGDLTSKYLDIFALSRLVAG